MTLRSATAVVFTVIIAACGAQAKEGITMMNAADVLALPQPEADHRLFYGVDPLQFGELRLPDGEGPYPVVILMLVGLYAAWW